MTMKIARSTVSTASTARALAVVVAAMVLAPLPPDADAAAPQAKTAPPGFYRLMIGKIEVTVLSDGTVDLPFDQILTNTTPEKVQAAFARVFLEPPVETSVNAFLVNTGSKLVLIDTGAGGSFGPTLGLLPRSLEAAGYKPEQVDEIYITHMHSDHLGGLAPGGKMAFPNATVRMDQRDSGHWLDEARMKAAPEGWQGTFKAAMALTKPYVDGGKLKPFDGKTELVPGVTAIPAYGHTPGHTVYAIESEGQRLVLWGDLMHVGAIQFDEPSVTIRYDLDSPAAAVERAKQFAEAAQSQSWVGAAHLQFPGIGHLRTQGEAFAFVPANYMRLR